MAEIKSLAAIGEKWGRVTPQRSQDYQNGVNNPRRSWQAAAGASGEAYSAGVQKAVSNGSFAKGVQAVSDAQFKQLTLAKGPTRFAEGVAVSKDRYAQGFAPYASVIQGLSLPPRGPKGDPRNIERVRVIAQALNAARVGQG